MRHQAIQEQMQRLAAFPSLSGCAVVDASTGMAWFHAGELEDLERVGEAAVEFWRIPLRLAGHFHRLGPPRSAACSFRDGVLALFPCCDDPVLVLVAIFERKDVAWPQLAPHVAALKVSLSQGFSGDS